VNQPTTNWDLLAIGTPSRLTTTARRHFLDIGKPTNKKSKQDPKRLRPSKSVAAFVCSLSGLFKQTTCRNFRLENNTIDSAFTNIV
jgi:hypothetical protein